MRNTRPPVLLISEIGVTFPRLDVFSVQSQCRTVSQAQAARAPWMSPRDEGAAARRLTRPRQPCGGPLARGPSQAVLGFVDTVGVEWRDCTGQGDPPLSRTSVCTRTRDRAAEPRGSGYAGRSSVGSGPRWPRPCPEGQVAREPELALAWCSFPSPAAPFCGAGERPASPRSHTGVGALL